MAMVALTTSSAGITGSLSLLRGWAARVVVAGTMGLSLLLVQTPFLAALLHLRPLHLDDWLLAIGSGLLASLLAAAAFVRRRAA